MYKCLCELPFMTIQDLQNAEPVFVYKATQKSIVLGVVI